MHCLLETKAINPPWRSWRYTIVVILDLLLFRGFAPEAGRGRAAAFEPGTILEGYQFPRSAENYWRGWYQFPDICVPSLPGTLQGRGYFPVSRYV